MQGVLLEESESSMLEIYGGKKHCAETYLDSRNTKHWKARC